MFAVVRSHRSAVLLVAEVIESPGHLSSEQTTLPDIVGQIRSARPDKISVTGGRSSS